ncbi:3-phosphoshikimate 1-carboxyvinyltransferase [Bizionia saleffrena]|uniref:3-phosphoshikimate 1-carboxyvinyltransferase n=1 Tax=Bizionia saleffrena TaxID=291189 RepID=A0A8H2LG28_9FLAO|nr:3-phosphoshikimate 1-carboxyvinyltransferase [Bizionia saleffrena]TYB77993.1 3-phosphoshikimate 1-carboxyvinyltransferase [Bizionia saleffrena]
MDIHLKKSELKKEPLAVQITGSKSETNRLLLLQALYPELHIENQSNSDDSSVMLSALTSKDAVIDIHHAGTAMRFLTAYFSTLKERTVTLTGSQRMTERPIAILVNALTDLGADIEYITENGFPPLRITGKTLPNHKVALQANVSSQYISALLLIAPTLKNGLELTLKGTITSVPYIKMTLHLLEQIGVKTQFENQIITVYPHLGTVKKQTIVVESDWSSASYFYSIVALSEIGTRITLNSYKKTSLQGDSVLAQLYDQFGVTSEFKDHTLNLTKTRAVQKDTVIAFNLVNAPDIAQTIAITALGLGLQCDLSGLHTLKIKETDRLEALKVEIEKLGGKIDVTDSRLHLSKNEKLTGGISIATYNDHRMAMAFAPLALKISILIEDASVVSKSYPTFWDDLKRIGFSF